jgi:Tetratricopeptide repeat
MRIRCVAAVIAGIVWCLAAPAHADPRSEIAAKTRAAMASYDSMDYEAARRLLNQALAIAKKAHLDKDPIVARVYLDLGITQLAGSDQEAARVALLSAVQIDPRIAIDAAYKSPELVKLLDEARAALGTAGTAGAADGGDGTGDTEDPISSPRRRPTAEVTDTVAPPHKAHKAAAAISGGTGFGYVTGRTEGDNQVQSCCIGSSPVVLQAELGYYTSARLSLGVAARIGFPIGANIAGHSTIAPAGFLRARYALSASADGLRIMGEIGAGILRNTIKLDNTMPNMDTDVVAQGPLLLGAGIGYIRHISSSVAFLVDLDAMAGIAVAKKLGSAVHLNTGVSADMRLGVAVGF